MSPGRFSLPWGVTGGGEGVENGLPFLVTERLKEFPENL